MSLINLNEILFEQINIMRNADVKDENFNEIRLRAETITNIGDRIIKNSELQLKQDVWQQTRSMTRSNKLLTKAQQNGNS